MIRLTWLLIASLLFSFSRFWISQACWIQVQHLTLTTSNWEGERSDLKLILLAIVKQCCSSRCVYCARATMRCLDAKMCRLIAGGTMVTSKEGVVHPKFWGGHPFVRWPWVGGKAPPVGSTWSKRLDGSPNCAPPLEKDVFEAKHDVWFLFACFWRVCHWRSAITPRPSSWGGVLYNIDHHQGYRHPVFSGHKNWR